MRSTLMHRRRKRGVYGGLTPSSVEIGAKPARANERKSYLPDDEIYLSRTTAQEFRRVLIGSIGKFVLVEKTIP